MQKNRFLMHAAQTAPSMPPSHSYTIVAAPHQNLAMDEESDSSDICPVCDGECTCHPVSQAQPPPRIRSGVPLSMAELSRQYAIAGVSASASVTPTPTTTPTPLNSSSSGRGYPPSSPTPYTTPPVPTPPPPKPSLKIKLTVPPSMLAKRKLPSQPHPSSSSPHASKSYKPPGETTFDYANGGYNSASDAQPQAPKKRGRPPKALRGEATHSSISPPYKPLNPKTAAPGKQQKKSASTKARQNLKARVGAVKKASKKRRMVTSDEESEQSDVDMDLGPRRGPVAGAYGYQGEDAESVQFPTFVSASALSSMSSSGGGSDSSSLSEFDSDSSIEKEEEHFILADVHDKTRIRRELLGGDDAPLLQKKRSGGKNSDWVVRPRKKSVGGSDVDMNVDSDATEDEDDDDEEGEEEEDEDGDETELEDATMMMPLPEEEDTDDHRHRYVGLATGWSEDDDESSFDADLFFANLSDTDSSSSDGDNHRLQPAFSMSMGDEGDQSDISSECTERRESLPFEVTEGWDGQIMFTNGAHDSRGIVDIEFEADASRFVVESTSASPSRCGDDARRGRRHGLGLGYPSDAEDSDVDMSDGGYEEEDGEGELGEGDTTDEELVGENDLPNERAMRLFSLPLSVSAINPLSTVSSPNVSPGRRRREDDASRERRRRRWGGEGLNALDILQGRVVFWDSDEGEDVFGTWNGIGTGAGKSLADLGLEEKKTGPRKGVFCPSGETRQAVIGEDRNGGDVPSPHPRFRGRVRPGRFSAVEHLLRRHLLQSLNASTSSPACSVPSSVVTSSNHADAPVTDERSPLELLLSSAAAVSGSAPEDVVNAAVGVSEAVGGSEPIDLDDVLEASFLDDTEPPTTTTHDDGVSLQSGEEDACATDPGAKNLSRWDLISVGAFRQTHHHHHLHTPSSSADFGSVIKSSPMTSVMWQHPASSASGSTSHARPAPEGTPMIKGKGSKLAKRRRIMMGGGGSGMSSPLILPVGSSNTTPPSLHKSASSSSSIPIPSMHDDKHQNQKNRKELRRERKLMKKRSTGYGGTPHAPHLAHTHHGHQFHTHHQHHPNAKARSVSSVQRGGWLAGGGGVPPLNL